MLCEGKAFLRAEIAIEHIVVKEILLELYNYSTL